MSVAKSPALNFIFARGVKSGKSRAGITRNLAENYARNNPEL